MPVVLRWFIANLIVLAPLFMVADKVYTWYPNDDDWPWWVAALLIGTLLVAGYAALRFWFATDPDPRETWKSTEELIAELEAKNLVRREVYHARRAFQVEETEDEGSNYFVELADGRVLFISGQILYEYELDESGEPRRFPCTEFELVLKSDTGDMIDLLCRGRALEPEVVAPAFTIEDFKSGWTPENLEILDKPYETLKQERLKGA
jgi:hypothetical protein